MRSAIGIDLGGTFIKGALVDETGEILYKEEIPTIAMRGAPDILDRIYRLVLRLTSPEGMAPRKIEGVGIGIPGFIDDKTGTAIEVVNLGWRNVAIRGPLRAKLDKPVYLENDANVAALGEAWIGAGRNRDTAICITLGTGVGGGIILNGKILRGVTVMAGEIGHMVLEPDGALCNCGHRGCLETVSSATGVVRLAKEALQAGIKSSMDPEDLTSADVFAALEQGDEVAKHIILHATDTLGRALGILANVINPEVMVIGGGMAKAGDALFVPLREAFERYALQRAAKACDIVPAILGNDAGVVGAANLALFR